MRTENIAFFRDMAEELAEIAKADEIETLAYLFEMAKIEAVGLAVTAPEEIGRLKKRIQGTRRRVSIKASTRRRNLPLDSITIDADKE